MIPWKQKQERFFFLIFLPFTKGVPQGNDTKHVPQGNDTKQYQVKQNWMQQSEQTL